MKVRGNFNYLLLSIVAFLATLSVLAQYPSAGDTNLVSIAFELSLIVAIWSLVKSKIWFIIGAVLIVIGAASIVLHFMFDFYWLPIVNALTIFLFYLMTTVIAFAEILSPKPIDVNKIVGSVSVYLLVGINWAFLYYFSELIFPGSFSGFNLAGAKGESFFDVLYYSYVTLSTLGYGDITPVAPIVRGLAMIEALFGQFYIAILVAILVGTHISAHKPSSKKKE